MKFWDAPEIHVIATPTVSPGDWTDVPACDPTVGGADALVELAGRACYWSYGKGRRTNEAYISHLLDAGHGSVLEHPTWTFGIKGISRSLSHELVRHRHFSFSQLSQRYVADSPEFVYPPALSKEAKVNFRLACNAAAESYYTQLDLAPDSKAGREVARAVLPNATATKIVVTGNARAIRHLLTLRGSAGADAEFRRLAVKWLELMRTLAPNLFNDFYIETIEGKECISSAYGSV